MWRLKVPAKMVLKVSILVSGFKKGYKIELDMKTKQEDFSYPFIS